MLFAAADFEVFMYDVERGRVNDALADIRVQLTNLEEAGLLRGRLTADEQHARVHPVDTLEECLSSAVYVQASICDLCYVISCLVDAVESLWSAQRTKGKYFLDSVYNARRRAFSETLIPEYSHYFSL